MGILDVLVILGIVVIGSWWMITIFGKPPYKKEDDDK